MNLPVKTTGPSLTVAMGVDTQAKPEQCKDILPPSLQTFSSQVMWLIYQWTLQHLLQTFFQSLLASLQIPWCRKSFEEYHHRSQRLSEELVPLVCFEWRSYYLPVSFTLVLEESGKNQFHYTFLQTSQFCKPLITLPLCHVFFQIRFSNIQWMGFLACCNGNHSVPLTILGHP